MYKNHWPWEEKQDDPQTFKKKWQKLFLNKKWLTEAIDQIHIWTLLSNVLLLSILNTIHMVSSLKQKITKHECLHVKTCIWPFLGPPWALGFLKHLHKEPDVYPLAMAPAKKTPLILNSFHFYSFFSVWLLVVDFSPCWAHFGPLLGAKILQSRTISSLAPNSILWLWD